MEILVEFPISRAYFSVKSVFFPSSLSNVQLAPKKQCFENTFKIKVNHLWDHVKMKQALQHLRVDSTFPTPGNSKFSSSKPAHSAVSSVLIMVHAAQSLHVHLMRKCLFFVCRNRLEHWQGSALAEILKLVADKNVWQFAEMQQYINKVLQSRRNYK